MTEAKTLRPRPRTPVVATQPTRIATVPDADVAARYIGRSFDGVREFTIFDYARTHHVNVLIEGPTGPGKTMASRAYAATNGLAFFAVSSNVGASPDQLFGKYVPNEDARTDNDSKFVWVDGPVTDLVRNGGLLLINEVNFLPLRVATVLFPLLDGNRQIALMDHRGEVIRAHRGPADPSDPMSLGCWCNEVDCTDKVLLIIADMNPDYAGTTVMNAAFRNRFGFQLYWDYSPEVELKLVRSNTLRGLAAKLRQEHNDGNIETPVSTNMLMEFEAHTLALGLDFAITMFVNHFGRDERSAVKTTIALMEENLKADYAPVQPEAAADSDEFEFAGAAADWEFGPREDF